MILENHTLSDGSKYTSDWWLPEACQHPSSHTLGSHLQLSSRHGSPLQQRFTPNAGFYTLLSQTPALSLSCLWRMTILPLVPQAKMYEVIFDSSFLPGSQAILSTHSVSPLKCIQLPTFLLLPSSRPPLVTSGTTVKWAWWPVFLFSLNFVWLSPPDWLNRFSQISLSSL